jgi:hypothetical protein
LAKEYYIYDPESELLDGWLRKQDKLTEITEMEGWTSPALGIRFQFIDGKLTDLWSGQPSFCHLPGTRPAK